MPFDEPLQADVPPDFEAEVVALEEEQEPGRATVPVAELVDAQEVEVVRPERDERVDGACVQDGVLVFDQGGHSRRRVGGPDGAEADLAAAGREHLDDVVLARLVLAGVAHPAS